MMMIQSKEDQSSLKSILIITFSLGLLSILISLVYFKEFAIVGGVFLGWILAMANFVFLIKIVVKMLDENYKRKPVLALFFLLKLAFITAVIAVGFVVLKVNTMAFACGYLSLILAILLQQVFGGKPAN